jgi:hypothetical protein
VNEPEARIARAVVTELQRQGFMTYEEVSLGYASHRADIVGVRGAVIAVVECKVTLGLALLNQLLWWVGRAHLLIGAHGFSRQSLAAERLAQHEGFGLWSVGGDEIHERVPPRLYRRAAVTSLRKVLRDEQRSGEYAQAGTNGGYWTPFRGTVRALTDLAMKQPGIELSEALTQIKHHYASARSAKSAIPALIRKGVITGLRCEGVPLRLYTDESPPPPRGVD